MNDFTCECVVSKNRDANKVSVVLYTKYKDSVYQSGTLTVELTPSYPCVWLNNNTEIQYAIPYVRYKGELRRVIPVVRYQNKLYKLYNTDTEQLRG